MRVTNGMIRNNMLSGLNVNMGKLDTLYNQMNSLKKIQRPSDDPIITGRSLKLRVNVLEVEQYKSNTEEATSWMSVTEKALSNVTEITKDIRTRCNNASSTATLGADDIDKLRVDINQLWEQVQQEANVSYVGKYIFSGYKTNEPVVLEKDTTLTEAVAVQENMVLPKGTIIPPAAATTTDTNVAAGYVIPAGSTLPKGTINPKVLGYIDNQQIQYEIGVGSTINVNTLGMDDVSKKIYTAIKDINDTLNSTTDLTVLHTTFNTSISKFDDILSDVSGMTADLGSRMQRLEYTKSRLSDDVTNFKELLSNTEDVDLEEIYTEFNAQYSVYQSALQATSKVITNTLADFLR